METNASNIREISGEALGVQGESEETKNRTLQSLEISKKASQKVVEISHMANQMMEQLRLTLNLSNSNEKIAEDLSAISRKMLEASHSLDTSLSTFKA